MVFLTSNGSALANGLSPKISSTKPTIDGIKESLWESQNFTTFTNINGNLLKVYTCVSLQTLVPYIYFGLEYKTSVHDKNESFAIACSNLAPGNQTINDSIWSYQMIKAVQMNKKSWDQQILRNPTRANNWSDGNYINFAVTNESSVNNASFYEIEFRCQYKHGKNNINDTQWAYGKQYAIRIYFGIAYGMTSVPGQPLYGSWTVSTPAIILTMPTDPSTPPTTFTPGEFNTLVAEIVFFVITGVILGMVGVYILQTKQRIKKV